MTPGRQMTPLVLTRGRASTATILELMRSTTAPSCRESVINGSFISEFVESMKTSVYNCNILKKIDTARRLAHQPNGQVPTRRSARACTDQQYSSLGAASCQSHACV